MTILAISLHMLCCYYNICTLSDSKWWWEIKYIEHNEVNKSLAWKQRWGDEGEKSTKQWFGTNTNDKTSLATAAGDILKFQPMLALQSLSSLTLHSHLPICRWGELSHHFCWVGNHFKVSIGHVSVASFCCQSTTFQNIWALANEWIVHSVFLVPFCPSRFFHFPMPQRKKECYSKQFEWWER